ncbi:hypothetical protein TrLO_g2313 [Triparma laevis f. longispina]|uniref:TraB family protein n=1 Tax=Triparma laevis f. longispina TaxID=1714387 RepID=A0A9W7CI20_9STRA|nr:hypothetical protein TrLO_g2313 [Triparma laevis f. longispina]
MPLLPTIVPSMILASLSAPLQAPYLTQFRTPPTKNNRTTTHIIIGTAHIPCNSAMEVRNAINALKPDALVLELDAERYELLCQMSSNSSTSYYGAEFRAAVSCAENNSIPIFFGDQKPQETLRALFSPATPILFPPPIPNNSTINVPQTLLSDPLKFLPLLPSTLLLPYLPPDPLTLLALALFLYRTYSIGILNRDAVLAENACHAAATMHRLQRKDVWRARFTINTSSALRSPPPLPSSSLPLFTTKRAIGHNESRRLSLFEPRWLRLVDFLSANPGAQVGLVNASNKVYTPKNESTRFADLILERKARMCDLVSVSETTRNVSGDRKAVIVLKGGAELIDVDESSVIFDNGLPLVVCDDTGKRNTVNENDETEKTVLSVVGLVHANGVMANIEKMIERSNEIKL